MRIHTPPYKDFIVEVFATGFAGKKNPHFILWWTMVSFGVVGGLKLRDHFSADHFLGFGIYVIGWLVSMILVVSLAWVILQIRNSRKKTD